MTSSPAVSFLGLQCNRTVRRTRPYLSCADANNPRVIRDLPAADIGDPNAGRAHQNLRDGKGLADTDDYLVCIHLPFIKADQLVRRNRCYYPPGMITHYFQALIKLLWPA